MAVIQLSIPKSYKELSEKQIRYIAELQVNGFDELKIWHYCFIKFSGIKPISETEDSYVFKLKKKFFTLTVSEMNYFAKKLNWITKTYFGLVPFSFGKYKPCDSLLRDTNFIQYLDAENFYQQFIYTKNEQALFNLAATLYQPGAKYDNKKTEKIANYFKKKLTEAEKIILIMWMMGIKEFFMKKFKFLFVNNSSEEADESVPDMFEIMKNQIRILTAGNIKDEPAILKSPTWSALYELNKKCEEADAMQRNSSPKPLKGM